MSGVQLRLLLQRLEIRSRRGWYRRGTEAAELLETVRIDLPEEQKAGLVWMRDGCSFT